MKIDAASQFKPDIVRRTWLQFAIMNGDTKRAKAIVTHRPTQGGQCNWKIENVTVPLIQDDELLVRVVAAGICHTDVAFSLRTDFLGIFPRILGHEGNEASIRTVLWHS